MTSKMEGEIERARRRPMDEAKMRELLLKLRKGASASLTFGKLVQVLDVLGYSIEPVLGWTQLHGDPDKSSGSAVLVDADSNRMHPDVFEQLHRDLKAAEVTRLPGVPSAVGERVVMKVGEIREAHRYDPKAKPSYYFYRKEWVGSEGVFIRSPSGAEGEFLPGRYRHEEGVTGPTGTSNVWRWLVSSGDVQEAINQALGTDVHIPAAERTRENTGTCPACWGNYKLSGDRLVLHGYKRPGYGAVVGDCFGVGYGPLETSVEGAIDYRELLKSDLDKAAKFLDRLISGQVASFKTRNGETIGRGDSRFDRTLEAEIDRTRRLVLELKSDIKTYEKVVDVWRPRPMPKEGELQRTLKFFLK